jgi:AraC-like DNA-binding protein
VLQFSGKCVSRGLAAFPELGYLERLLADSQRGILFSNAVARRAAPLLNNLLAAHGFQRVYQFLALLDLLAQAQDNTLLATPTFRPDPEGYRSTTIAEHLGDGLRESDLARYANMEPSAFSRFFRRHTGVPFIQYLIRLRVNRACELLIAGEKSVTEICYVCGFNNVSNFNRQFLALKAMPPSQFRRYHRMNDAVSEAPA